MALTVVSSTGPAWHDDVDGVGLTLVTKVRGPEQTPVVRRHLIHIERLHRVPLQLIEEVY